MNQPVTYWAAFGWGLVVLCSLIGWGSGLARLLRLRWDAGADWGIRAGWGMCLTLAIGGLLACASVATRAVLTTFTLAGFGIWLCDLTALRRVRPAGQWPAIALRLLGLSALLLLWYAPSVRWGQFNPWDDYLAYFIFPQRLLETGTMLEPFSLRRLSAFGGQSLLQAILRCRTTEVNMAMLEGGLTFVLIGGLLYGHLRAARRGLAISLAVPAFFLLIPVAQHNIASLTTGIVVLVTLYRTLYSGLALPARAREHAATGAPVDGLLPWRFALLTGMAIAAVCSLRPSYLPGAALTAVLALGIRAWQTGAWKGQFYRLTATLGAALMLLLPWMLLLYQSSGSLFYPFQLGNHRMLPDMLSAHLSSPAMLAWIGGFMVRTPVLFLLLLPSLFLVMRCFDAAAMAHIASSAVSVVMLLWSLTALDYENIFRYAEPILLTGMIAAVLAVLGPGGAHRKASSRNLALVLLLALWMPFLLRGAVRRAYMVHTVPGQIAASGTLAPEAEIRLYRQVQQSMPPGAPVLTALHFPWLLDFARQPIYHIDLMGLCSPAPGLPVFHGPQAMKTYLQAQGIRYIAAQNFDNPTFVFEKDYTEYSRSMWLSRRYRWEREQLRMVPIYLDVMNSIDQLEKTEEVVFRTPTVRVIRLR